jgi:SAM-dependent methyltransferase
MGRSRDFWSMQAARWHQNAEDADSFYARRTALVADLIERHAGGKQVLDVGCGSGELCGMLATRGFSVHGTDLSEEMVALARARCHGLVDAPTLRFLPCTEESIPFDGLFDVVTAIGVVPYVADHHRFVARLARRITPDGLLVVTSTNRLSLFTGREVVLHLARFQPMRGWWIVLINLLRTGVWSGGFVEDHSGQARSAAAFDRIVRSAGLNLVTAADLFNIRLFGVDLDDDASARSRIQALLARRFAWTHIGVFQRMTAIARDA